MTAAAAAPPLLAAALVLLLLPAATATAVQGGSHAPGGGLQQAAGSEGAASGTAAAGGANATAPDVPAAPSAPSLSPAAQQVGSSPQQPQPEGLPQQRQQQTASGAAAAPRAAGPRTQAGGGAPPARGGLPDAGGASAAPASPPALGAQQSGDTPAPVAPAASADPAPHALPFVGGAATPTSGPQAAPEPGVPPAAGAPAQPMVAGAAAVEAMSSDQLASVAASAGWTPELLRQRLMADPSLKYVPSAGRLLYSCKFGHGHGVDGLGASSPAVAPGAGAPPLAGGGGGSVSAKRSVPAGQDDPPPDQAFNLSSRPASSKVIYLHFAGQVVKGTLWLNGSEISCPPFDLGERAAAAVRACRELLQSKTPMSRNAWCMRITSKHTNGVVDRRSPQSDRQILYGGVHTRVPFLATPPQTAGLRALVTTSGLRSWRYGDQWRRTSPALTWMSPHVGLLN